MVELFENNGDPDQTPRSAASDLGLHCFPITRFGVSSLQWVKSFYGVGIDTYFKYSDTVLILKFKQVHWQIEQILIKLLTAD